MTEYASGRRVRIVKANGEKVQVNINRIHRGLEADYVMDPTDRLIIQRSLPQSGRLMNRNTRIGGVFRASASFSGTLRGTVGGTLGMCGFGIPLVVVDTRTRFRVAHVVCCIALWC